MKKSFFYIGILLLELALASSAYKIEDNIELMKAFVPELIANMSAYVLNNPSLPDFISFGKGFEHLGLIHNKWTKITPSNNSEMVKKFNGNSAGSTIDVEVIDPATFEIDSEYVYNYLIIPIVGSLKINGAVKSLNFTFNFSNDNPEKQLKATIKKFNIEIKISPIAIEENILTKFFNVTDLIEKTIVANLTLLHPNFQKGLDDPLMKKFSGLYPPKATWEFSSITGEKYSIQNDFTSGKVVTSTIFEVTYNTDDPSLSNNYKAPLETISTLTLNFKIIKPILEKVYSSSRRSITDKDLSETLQDRLDIKTFQKFIPDAALKSIKEYGVANNNVTLDVIPTGKFALYFENDGYLSMNANYNFTLFNSMQGNRLDLISGNMTLEYDLEYTWKNVSNEKRLNFQLSNVKLNEFNTKEPTYEVVGDRLKNFLSVIFEDITKNMNGLNLLKDGIPLTDSALKYNETIVEVSTDEIKLIHH